MSAIKAILWDVDGTLLDFKSAERAALRAGFEEFNLGQCDDELIAEYSAINVRYWELLELGRFTKPEILVGRFEELFSRHGIDTGLAADFDAFYHRAVAEVVVYNDESLEVIRQLRREFPHVKHVVVSNGTHDVQMYKLHKAGFDALLDGIVLSDDVGHEKPDKRFFDAVFALLAPLTPEDMIIVGDSLTGDIRGGNNVGIPTVWYNPAHLVAPYPDHFDRELADLHDVIELVRASYAND